MELNEQDKELLGAVNDNKIDDVKTLIKAGANLNIQNEKGDTILMIAIDKKNSEIAKLLIENGANLDI
jgi:ankyrin repeat protein